MKLKFDRPVGIPDPFIFEDEGKLYLYVTAPRGVEAYSADDLFGVWHYEGIVASFAGRRDYWAPSVLKHNNRYYLYVSCSNDEEFQFMHAAVAESPLGPFTKYCQMARNIRLPKKATPLSLIRSRTSALILSPISCIRTQIKDSGES